MRCSSSLLVSPENIYISLATDIANHPGTDTTAHTLTTGTWYLINNPDMLKLLRKELVEVLPDVDSGVTVDWATLEKLPYLVSFHPCSSSQTGILIILIPFPQRAVVKESLRLSLGVCGRIPRVVPANGAVFCGRQIPPEVHYLS